MQNKDILEDYELNTPIYFDDDIDLMILDKPIAIIGYGNQGRAQALNLRDNGCNVLIGNILDRYRNTAIVDGFNVHEISEVVQKAHLILFLIPDEVQPLVFRKQIEPFLKDGQVLCFASGYNIAFGLIPPLVNVDVVLVAPRMIGHGVRHAFCNNQGFYSFIAIENDYSKKARQYALAIAKGIGSTKPGGAILEVTFKIEAELDLVTEQCFGPAFGQVLLTAVEVALEAGYPPEAVFVELYMSGELSYTIQKMASMGIVNQMRLHSPVSQYGSMSRGLRYINPEIKVQMEESLTEIQDGSFVEEFREEGFESLEELKELAQKMPINVLEEAIRKKLHIE